MNSGLSPVSQLSDRVEIELEMARQKIVELSNELQEREANLREKEHQLMKYSLEFQEQSFVHRH